MLPSSQRLSRRQFQEFLENKGILVAYNRLGTLKYIPGTSQLAVVTSSKIEKKAVVRNKLRRRIYTTFGLERPSIKGVLYVSKQSYTMTHNDVQTLLHELIGKTTR
jgi:ribonuclease P protein component